MPNYGSSTLDVHMIITDVKVNSNSNHFLQLIYSTSSVNPTTILWHTIYLGLLLISYKYYHYYFNKTHPLNKVLCDMYIKQMFTNIF